MQDSLPQDKVIRLQEELAQWSNRRKGTPKELQSLIGSLNFACRVSPSGRAFLQRIINLTIGIKKPYHHVRLNAAFFEDIRMWQIFLKDWNGKQFFSTPHGNHLSLCSCLQMLLVKSVMGEFSGASGFRVHGKTLIDKNRVSALTGRSCTL